MNVSYCVNYCLRDARSAANLSGICQEYKDDLVIDVKCGHYIVDGASILGVASLIGHTVEVLPFGTDDEIVKRFLKEISECC